MFTRLGTNTIFFATMILVGFGLVGCGSEGGSGGTGGSGATGGVGGVGGIGGIGGDGACGQYETCGLPIVNYPPASAGPGANPCLAPYMPSCGSWQQPECLWDVQASECWTTPWCEPSVASVGKNIGSLNGSLDQNIRPVSAKCGPGDTTYTFAPGTLMVLGFDMKKYGFECAVNTTEEIINC